MTIETLDIDIAKNVFQLHGVNQSGKVVLTRPVMRDQLLEILAQINRCMVIVEACTGAFCWVRKVRNARPALSVSSFSFDWRLISGFCSSGSV
jgi:hypothetical protein